MAHCHSFALRSAHPAKQGRTMASKPNIPSQQKHLAVLIDADNAPAAIVEGLFEEIAKYGIASVKRIYGDWTGPRLAG
jgi:hypothetical protein